MKNLIIIGAGGHGKSVAWVAKSTNKWKNIFFLDDNIKNSLVLGNFQDRLKFKNDDFFIGIGNNTLRKKIFKILKSEKYSLPSIISPSSDTTIAKIGSGSIVMNHCFINVDTIIGECVIVNNNVVIEHDCKIESFCHVSPSVTIGGGTSVKNSSWIGLGSNLIQGLTICANVTIGAGAVVTSSINKKGTYVGIPARQI